MQDFQRAGVQPVRFFFVISGKLAERPPIERCGRLARLLAAIPRLLPQIIGFLHELIPVDGTTKPNLS